MHETTVLVQEQVQAIVEVRQDLCSTLSRLSGPTPHTLSETLSHPEEE
jgi:hypothetical protein